MIEDVSCRKIEAASSATSQGKTIRFVRLEDSREPWLFKRGQDLGSSKLMLIIPALKKLRKDDCHKLEANLGYTAKSRWTWALRVSRSKHKI